jgi:hypothetical protein
MKEQNGEKINPLYHENLAMGIKCLVQNILLWNNSNISKFDW